MRIITTQTEFNALIEITDCVELHGNFTLKGRLKVSGTGSVVLSETSSLKVCDIGRLLLYGSSSVVLSGSSSLKVCDIGSIAVFGTCRFVLCGTSRLKVSSTGSIEVSETSRLVLSGTGSLILSGSSRIKVYDTANLVLSDGGNIVVSGKPIAGGEQARENLQRIATLALAPGCLKMSAIHTCDTVHCIAGWACHSLPSGRELEKRHDWYAAGLALLGFDASRHFYDSNAKARRWLNQYLPSQVATCRQ